MPDYSQSKIYTVRFINNDNHIYIGSTTQSLAKRLGGHKFLICSLYKYINDTYNNDWSKCYIELFEEYKCDNKEQLNKREGEIIRDFMNNDKYIVINQRIAGRTQKEYLKDNEERLKEKKRPYNKEYRRNIYLNNIEKYKQYREDNKEKNKKYREDNKEKYKQYYEANKNKINEKRREKEKERKRDLRQRNRIFDFLELIKHL